MSKVIKLTESDLHNMIKEAINELDWKSYPITAKKANAMDDFDKSDNPHLNENKIVKLTESDLHNMIKNAITELKNNK